MVIQWQPGGDNDDPLDLLEGHKLAIEDGSYEEKPMTKKQAPKQQSKTDDNPRNKPPTEREIKAAVLIAEYSELNVRSDFVSELAFQSEQRGILDGQAAEVKTRLHDMVVSAGGQYTMQMAQQLAELMEAELFIEAEGAPSDGKQTADDEQAPPTIKLPTFKYEAFVENPDLSKLFQYIAQADIEWRQGATSHDKKKVQMLPYVDARAVMRILNETFGLMGWRPEYTPLHGGGFLCRLWVFYGGEWHYKEDGAQETQIEAVKGGISGALKRAAAAWGIAQYLYYSDPVWITITEGQKYVSKQQIAGLRVKINGKQVGE